MLLMGIAVELGGEVGIACGSANSRPFPWGMEGLTVGAAPTG